MFILKLFIFGKNAFFGWNCDKLDWSPFNGFDNIWPFEIDILIVAAFLFNFFQERIIICVRPGVEKRDKNLFIWGHSMFEGPLDPTLVKFLHKSSRTIREVSTLCAILFQSWLLS